MIFIFGNKEDDNIKLILKWLKYYRKKYLLIVRGQNFIDIREAKFENGKLEGLLFISGYNITISISEVESILFWRGRVEILDFFYDAKAVNRQKSIKDLISTFLTSYSVSKLELLSNILNNKKIVGESALGRYNKMKALKVAYSLGVKIPPTILTTKKKDVVSFKEKYNRIITKSLDINLDFNDTENSMWYHQYTCEVEVDGINNFPEIFPLTKFQKLIPKKYEIRTFFINGKTFSGALFSQKNERTEVDYRRYNYERMNRLVPFEFSVDMKSLITKLMRNLDLNTGSLDFIKGIDNNFYFLEVNPVGQFGYLSANCNHKLYKEIAKELIYG